jgi:hypothetical protein
MDAMLRRQLAVAGPLLLLLVLLVSGLAAVFWGDEGRHADHQLLHVSSAGVPEGYELLLAQVVHRHGARTPLNTAFFNDTPWSICQESYPVRACGRRTPLP